MSQGCGLAPLKGADEEHTGLGAIVSDLMLDTVDLVLQHGLRRGREGPERGRVGSDATTLGATTSVVRQGGYITDQGDFQTSNLQSPNRGFTT